MKSQKKAKIIIMLRESELRSQNEVKLKDRLEKFTPEKRRKVAQK